ncbi:MAG: OmpA family protein [Desulfatibacillum sp.]|nr:OmpA family protein [Desulfatibacillum sp.]
MHARGFFFNLIVALALAAAVAGCASGPKPACPFAADQNFEFSFPEQTQKVDSFYVILDGSESMGGSRGGLQKFAWAKNIVLFMNQAISDLDLKAGLRTYGLNAVPSGPKTDLVYGFSKYSSQGYADAVKPLWGPNGPSPLGLAIKAADKDLCSISGRTALIILSDGNPSDDAVKEARKLKDRLGSKLCISTIAIGANSAGKELLNGIARIGGCDAAFDSKDLCTGAGMTQFVSKVFYSDAPKPAPALDVDGDGVLNMKDQCPYTPKGATVNEKGCWEIVGLTFDTDKANIKPEFLPLIYKVIPVLNNNPAMKIQLQGHADNRGTMEHNQALSEQRAKAVKKVLIKKGVDANRLSTKGFGFYKPIVPNDSEANMARNRRVEIREVK